MSGHSKWSTIKRKKGEADAKKGKIFTKLVREITIAARLGGGDPAGNPRLRAAIAAAKAARMPSENIERATKKGTGELEGATIEEAAYEGYGPGGVAFYIETQTDNRNRTTSEVRSVFTKASFDLGKSGSVAYQFHKQGRFVFDGARYTEEELVETALEAGADDVVPEGGNFVVTCEPKAFGAVADHFDKLQMQYDEGDLTMVPENTVAVAGQEAENVVRFMEKLEELDDVQKVYANFDISDDDLERIAGAG